MAENVSKEQRIEANRLLMRLIKEKGGGIASILEDVILGVKQGAYSPHVLQVWIEGAEGAINVLQRRLREAEEFRRCRS